MDQFTKFQLSKGEKLTPQAKEELEIEIDQARIILSSCYQEIINILKEYLDIKEEYYPLISIWIIGTYLHDSFETYPYLFINAMRGSGKTRLLKIIESLSKNGELLTSLKESVLFRTAKGKTLCIDEFESIGNKENQALRELLNACYKRGMKVQRMKKVKKLIGEEYEVESFEPYTPICMANIWGIEEVLSDRAITMILEKSANPYFNLIMEDFKTKPIILDVKTRLTNLVQLCSYFGVKEYIIRWNQYIKNRYRFTPTYNTYNTHTTLTTLNNELIRESSEELVKDSEYLYLFDKIHDSGISGRNLELFFPLFLLSDFISQDIFNQILNIGINITNERRENEMIESRDVMFIDFISQLGLMRNYITVRQLTSDFRHYIGDDEGEDKWINTRWVGRSLKRLSLIKDKRRMKEGVEVIPDIDHAIEKLKVFQKKQ